MKTHKRNRRGSAPAVGQDCGRPFHRVQAPAESPTHLKYLLKNTIVRSHASLVVAPMMMFGCAYYPWSALESFPVLHLAVLVNPLVYASEGLRGALVPQVPHMNTLVVIGALAAIDLGLLYLGLKKFHQKAVS